MGRVERTLTALLAKQARFGKKIRTTMDKLKERESEIQELEQAARITAEELTLDQLNAEVGTELEDLEKEVAYGINEVLQDVAAAPNEALRAPMEG